MDNSVMNCPFSFAFWHIFAPFQVLFSFIYYMANFYRRPFWDFGRPQIRQILPIRWETNER